MGKPLRLCTISLPYAEDRGVAGNLDMAIARLHEAARHSPDLICLPELFPYIGVPIERALPAAEPIPGPMTDRLAALAREHGCWLAGGTFANQDGAYRNTCFVLDDRGEVRGTYHKMFPTLGELEAGIVPGESSLVLDSPWGRIGVAICFDMNFDEAMNGLGDANAQLVLFPSFYHAGIQNALRCFRNGYYIASALVTGASGRGGFVVNPLGRVLGAATAQQPILCRDLNLDFVVAHRNFNEEQIERMIGTVGEGVVVETAEEEENVVISSNLEDGSARDLTREFRIELRHEYLNKARRLRSAALHR